MIGLFKKIERSARLVGGMADRRGVSLGDEIHAHPDFAGPEYRTLVLTCCGCQDQDDCEALQAENASLDSPPPYCKNRERFS